MSVRSRATSLWHRLAAGSVATALVALFVAGPALATTAPIEPYDGHVERVSVHETLLLSGDDMYSIRIDFCVSPGASRQAGAQRIDLGTSAPYAPAWNRRGSRATTMHRVVDATGRHEFAVELQVTENTVGTSQPTATVAIRKTGAHSLPDGGCGTLMLPVPTPYEAVGVRGGTYAFAATDRSGRRHEDTLWLPAHYQQGSPGLYRFMGDLDWDGTTNWTVDLTPHHVTPWISASFSSGATCGQLPDAAVARSHRTSGESRTVTVHQSCWEDRTKVVEMTASADSSDRFVIRQRNTAPVTDSSVMTVSLQGSSLSQETRDSVRVTRPSLTMDRVYAPPTVQGECRTRFTDNQAGDPFFIHLLWMGCSGISTGYADGSFGTRRDITRGELATFLYRAEAAGGALAWEPPADSPFADLPTGDPHYLGVTWLRSLGISGYKDGTFRPRQPVTRAETARMVHLIAGRQHPGEAPEGQVFRDVPTNHWSHVAVSYLRDRGATKGYADGTFRPNRNITRGETAKLIESIFAPGR